MKTGVNVTNPEPNVSKVCNCRQIQRPGSRPRVQKVGPSCVKKCGLHRKSDAIRSDSIQKMCRKCVTVVESSAPGPSPGSEQVSKVCNCRKIQLPEPRLLVQNGSNMWPASQIQGPGSGNTALREKEPSAGSKQIGTKSIHKSERGSGGSADHHLLIH